MAEDTGRHGKNRTCLPSLRAAEMHVRCVRMASSTSTGLISYSLAVLGYACFSGKTFNVAALGTKPRTRIANNVYFPPSCRNVVMQEHEWDTAVRSTA